MITALIVIVAASVVAHIWLGLWARRNWKSSEKKDLHV